VPSTRELLRAAGAREGAIFGRLTDREAYDAILDGNAGLAASLAFELADAMVKLRSPMIVADAIRPVRWPPRRE